MRGVLFFWGPVCTLVHLLRQRYGGTAAVILGFLEGLIDEAHRKRLVMQAVDILEGFADVPPSDFVTTADIGREK